MKADRTDNTIQTPKFRMENGISFASVLDFFNTHDGYLIFTHVHPDADTIGSALALKMALCSIGKRAEVCCLDKIPSFLRFLYQDGDILFSEDNPFVPTAKTFISVDVATIELLGKNGLIAKHPIDLALDHHRTHVPFSEYSFVDPAAAACGEIIYEIVLGLTGVSPSDRIADCLYAAISADTGSFKYSNTTSRTLRIAAKLVESGIDSAAISTHLFDEKSIVQLRAEGLAYSKMKTFAEGRGVIVSFDRSDYEEHELCEEEMGTISSCIKPASGTDMAIAVRYHDEGEYKVSVRSSANVDASAFCRNWGGGGHLRASGCTVYAHSAAEAEQMLLEKATALLQGEKQSV